MLCNLKSILKDKNIKQEDLADNIQMNESTFSLKLNSKRNLKLSEFENIVLALGIEGMTIEELFFKKI